MTKSLTTLSLLAVFAFPALANDAPSADNSVPGVAERPQPQVPVQPPVDNSPERPQAQVPVQPPVDNTPDRPVGDATPDRGYPTDPDFGLPYEPQMPTLSDTQRISTLELQYEKLVGDLNDYSEQLDGVRAGMHAITNARPMVNDGEFAIGAGVGFAGSKEAVALGGAYGVNKRFSISGTLHYESSGSYSSSDVSGGIGIQYKFN